MASAPPGVVAVPTTVAPACPNSSAMALPMPRLAPLTRAISFSSDILFSNGSEPHLDRQGCRQAGRVIYRQGLDRLVDTLVESGQDLAWPHLETMIDSLPTHGLHRFHPAHRAVQL